MAWIKRNLALVIGIAVSLLLLVGAGGYLVANEAQDYARDEDLAKLKVKLDSLRSGTFPSEANIGAVRTNVTQVLKFTAEAERILASEPPKPVNVSFSVHLTRVLDEMWRDATNAGVELPPQPPSKKYQFTFGEVLSMSSIPRYGIEPLNSRLAEMKTICDVLFKARVRGIESLQRLAAFADEPKGPDLLLDRTEQTNSLATGVNVTITPYRVVFRGFSGDLAVVLNTLSGTKDFFVVREVLVERLGSAGMMNPGMMNPGMMNPGMMNPGMMTPGMMTPGPFGAPGPGGAPGMLAPGMTTPPPPGGFRPVAPKAPGTIGTQPVSKSSLVKILDEQPLRITLVLDLIKVTRKAVAPTPTPPKNN